MTKFKSIYELVTHIVEHYSRFADHISGMVYNFNQLARLACSQIEEPAIVSASFDAVINPEITDGLHVDVVLTIRCDNPEDWLHSSWTCIAQSKGWFTQNML
jgi:hypothetical protein